MRHVVSIAKTSCVLAMFLWLSAACTEESSRGSITLTSSAAVELYPTSNQTTTVTFRATSDWSATCSADWLVYTPKSGGAGDQTIKLTTTSLNRTKVTRSAQLVITSGSSRKNVTIVQSGKYAVFNNDEYVVGPEGGTLTLEFVSNVEQSDELQVGYGRDSWFSWADGSRMTRAEWKGTLPQLVIQPNTAAEGRTMSLALLLKSADGAWLGLDTCFVHQRGVVSEYESTDYSADGRVTLLQQSTQGRGIPLIIMGDGYADRDIADGTYMQVMGRAMENMFTEEPVRSLRNYFNVYVVTAVSRNSGVGDNYKTVFSTVPSISSTGIACDDQKVREYAGKVPGVDLTNALVVVIVNSHAHNGVTYWYSDEKQPLQFSIALCPVVDNLESEVFRQVLTHEAIGHGLAKLGDEYGYESNGAATEDIISKLTALHQYGWNTNVDSHNDPVKVVWRQFIGDTHFQNEYIGVFEGGYTYVSGVYRPTEESMMRSNQSPFNAPSRYAIYAKVMALGEGRNDVTYDEFVTFDEQHKPERWNYAVTRGRLSVDRRLAPPVMRRYSR